MAADDRPRNALQLLAMKAAGRRITMMTCYDAAFARLIAETSIDVLLVGDSVNQVVAGHETTLSATLDQMIYHASAVRRGAPKTLLFVDLPFLTYQVTVEEAIRNAGRVMAATGAQGVKVEGGTAIAPTIGALVECGIPVIGHLGLRPQSVHALGGYRVQGRGADDAERLIADARAIEAAGACAIVLELVPAALATRVTEALRIPTVGIGAGQGCDGQVLVLYDILGLNPSFSPRFLKRYADLATVVTEAMERFAAEVREGRYPGPEHSFE